MESHGCSGSGPDGISHLPEAVLHRIMSLLPERDLARMSVMSRTFYSAWSSFSVIDLSHHFFSSRDGFADYVNRSVSRRVRSTDVVSLRLHAACFSDDVPFPGNLSSPSVKELRLKSFEVNVNDIIQSFPSLLILDVLSCNVLEDVCVCSNNLEMAMFRMCGGMKKLKIESVSLKHFSYRFNYWCTVRCEVDVTNCPSLKNLTVGVRWDVDEPCKPVSQLGRLEELELEGYGYNAREINVSNKKLKKVTLHGWKGVETIGINTPSLEYLKLSFIPGVHDVDMRAGCENIGHLWLHSVGVTEGWVATRIPLLRHLRTLNLSYCDELETVHISNQSLRVLEVKSIHRYVELRVHAPQLTTLTGCIICPRLIHAPLLRNTALLLCWALDPRDIIRLDSSQDSLTIGASFEESLSLEKWRGFGLPRLYETKNVTFCNNGKQDVNIRAVMDCLLFLSPRPNSIYFDGHNGNRRLQFEYGKEGGEGGDANQSCCAGTPIKCWKHSLKKVKMQNFRDDEREWAIQYFSEVGAVAE